MRLEYTVAHRLNALHDQLVAAGIRPTYVGGDPDDPDGVVLEVPDGTDPQAVAAVVAAHNPAAHDAAQQQERDRYTQDVAGLKQYQALASPTLAQTVAATKAQNRMLARIIAELRE